VVNVEAESADPSSVLSWYRTLASLRARRSELVAGSYEELMADDEQVYAFRRTGDASAAVVLANLSGKEASYDPSLVAGMALLAGTHGETATGTLRPLEAVVFGD
jgi:alpha-glucosidase